LFSEILFRNTLVLLFETRIWRCRSIAFWTLNTKFCVTDVEKVGAETNTEGKRNSQRCFGICSLFIYILKYNGLHPCSTWPKSDVPDNL